MVGNAAFLSTCSNVLVYSLIPPPTPLVLNQVDEGPWSPQQLELEVQAEVVAALDKVRLGQRLGHTAFLNADAAFPGRQRISQLCHLRASVL